MHREIPHALKEISKKAALFEKKTRKKTFTNHGA
jgi:hypothetical protein